MRYFLKQMERLVNPALGFCMVIRRMEHCFLYQLAIVDFKSSSYQICCQHSAHQRWVVSEGILASVFLSFPEVPTTVPRFMSIALFNPFRSFADEEIRTRGVSPPQAGVGGVDSNLPDPRSHASATGQPEPLNQTSGLPQSLCVSSRTWTLLHLLLVRPSALGSLALGPFCSAQPSMCYKRQAFERHCVVPSGMSAI